jgi:hypothetical protein
MKVQLDWVYGYQAVGIVQGPAANIGGSAQRRDQRQQHRLGRENRAAHREGERRERGLYVNERGETRLFFFLKIMYWIGAIQYIEKYCNFLRMNI